MDSPIFEVAKQTPPKKVETPEEKLARGLLKGAQRGYRESESKRPLGFGEARRVAKAKLKAPAYQDVIESALHMSAKTAKGEAMQENTPVARQSEFRVDPATRDRIIKEFQKDPEAAIAKYTEQRNRWRSWRQQSQPKDHVKAPAVKSVPVGKEELAYRAKQESGAYPTMEEVQAAEAGGYNKPFTVKSEEAQALELAPTVKGFAKLDHSKPAKQLTATAEEFVKTLVDGAAGLVDMLPGDPGLKSLQGNLSKATAFLVGQTLMTPVRVQSALDYMNDEANPPFDRAMSALGMLLDLEGVVGGPITSPFVSSMVKGGWKSASKFLRSFGKAETKALAEATGNSEAQVEALFNGAKRAVDEVPEAEAEALFDSHDLIKNLERPVAEEPKLPTREDEALQESELRDRLATPEGVETTRMKPDGSTERVTVVGYEGEVDGVPHVSLKGGGSVPLDEVLPPPDKIAQNARTAPQEVPVTTNTSPVVDTPQNVSQGPETAIPVKTRPPLPSGSGSRLSQYHTGPVYRETTLDSLIDDSYRETGSWWATNADHATGQYGNTGVKIEFQPKSTRGTDYVQFETSKPTAQHLWAENGTAEFMWTNTDNKMPGDIVSVTVSPGATAGKSTDFAFKNLVGKWTKETLPDGSIKYTRPASTPATKAKEEFTALWKEIMDDASETNIGSGLGGLTPGQLKAVSKLPALALKGLEYGFKSATEFAEWAGKNIGTWAKESAMNAWNKVHGGEFGLAAKYEPEGSPTGGTFNLEEMAAKGRDLIESGKVSPDTIYSTVKFNGRVSPEEIAAVAYRGTVVKNASAEIERKLIQGGLDDAEIGLLNAEYEKLETEMGHILDVANVAQKTFHETGKALQIAFNRTYDPVEVMARAKAANLGQEVSERVTKKLDENIRGLKSAEVKATKEVEKAAESIKTRGPSIRSKVPSERRQALIAGLKSNLGLDTYKPFNPKNKGRTQGGITVAPGKERQTSIFVNGAVREYINDGATTLDEVVAAFMNDIPALNRDDVLGLINGDYKKALLEADVHKMEIERALQAVRRQAKEARMTQGERILNNAGDGVVSLSRQMQSGLDASLSFIQGLPGLEVSPSNWGKAWIPWFKVMFAKKGKAEFAVALENARLHRTPGFSHAKKAGVGFSDFSGFYSVQEEQMIGHLVQKARESGNPLVRGYFEVLARSQEAGTAFLNELRLNLFKKFVAGNWNDEQSLKDAAALTNIITGRGSGAMADALSAKPMGYIAYAPRYAWSKYQNAALPLLMPTKITSASGRKAAASVWSKQTVAAYLAAPLIAKSLGMDVELDQRSGQYGAITLPNGGKVRLFKHFTEPLSTLYQIANGRVSKSGTLTKPGYPGSATIAGAYATGKLSPIAGTAWQQLTNNRYDEESGEGVETRNPQEWLGAAGRIAVPLSVQAITKNLKKGDLLGAFLGLLGIEYSPAGESTGKTSGEPDKELERLLKEFEMNPEIDPETD